MLDSLFKPKDKFGIRNEKRSRKNEYSFNWKMNDGYINVTNPFQGIMVIGGAGSGKSYTVAEPIIDQATEKGYAGLIYDYKFPVLTCEVHKAFIKYGVSDRKLWIVNFKDITRSHRVNPIAPENMPVSAYANEFAMTVMKNLKKDWIDRQDFWADNAIAFFKAIIWFLKRNEPENCTLPHAVTLALSDYPRVLNMILQDPECKGMIMSLGTAHDLQAEGQVAGVVSGLQNPIDKLNTPEIFWVLSGNDFSLDLNDPNNPSVLCLGNDPELQDTFSPVIGLIATAVMKKINQQGKRQSIFLLDEAPTLFIPNLHNLPATARSNKVATVYMTQDFSQMELLYGKEQARALSANLGNRFIGMVNDTETAKQVSEIFGRAEKLTESFTKSSGGSSTLSANSGGRGDSKTYSYQEKELIPASEIMGLPLGTFVGKVTDGKQPFFKGKPIIEKDTSAFPINPFYNFDGQNISEVLRNNYHKIRHEAEDILIKWGKDRY